MKYFKTYMILFAIFFFWATTNLHSKRDKDVDIILHKFTDLYGKKVKLPTVVIDNLDSDTLAGYCVHFSNKIILNSLLWSNYSYDMREQLLFHELGHCTLKRSHITSKDLSDGCPQTIMTPFLMSKRCYKKHKQYYHKELFNGYK